MKHSKKEKEREDRDKDSEEYKRIDKGTERMRHSKKREGER
jgi:hypothetical protein